MVNVTPVEVYSAHAEGCTGYHMGSACVVESKWVGHTPVGFTRDWTWWTVYNACADETPSSWMAL